MEEKTERKKDDDVKVQVRAIIARHGLTIARAGELMGMGHNSLANALSSPYKLAPHRLRLLQLEVGEALPQCAATPLKDIPTP